MNSAVVVREAVRAIVLNSGGAVLLQHMEAESGRCWILPGGGLAPGESHEQALVRELGEELGLRLTELGPWVWRRTAEFSFRGRRYRQHERFYLVRAEPFEFDHSGLDEIEQGIVIGHQWWSTEDIKAATDLIFWPSNLAQLLRPLVIGEVPEEPLDIGD
jgi:ADP-ribose pyrophosphatase YjhB (NUDIX family)